MADGDLVGWTRDRVIAGIVSWVVSWVIAGVIAGVVSWVIAGVIAGIVSWVIAWIVSWVIAWIVSWVIRTFTQQVSVFEQGVDRRLIHADRVGCPGIAGRDVADRHLAFGAGVRIFTAGIRPRSGYRDLPAASESETESQ
jgi:hypothetical protein